MRRKSFPMTCPSTPPELTPPRNRLAMPSRTCRSCGLIARRMKRPASRSAKLQICSSPHPPQSLSRCPRHPSRGPKRSLSRILPHRLHRSRSPPKRRRRPPLPMHPSLRNRRRPNPRRIAATHSLPGLLPPPFSSSIAPSRGLPTKLAAASVGSPWQRSSWACWLGLPRYCSHHPATSNKKRPRRLPQALKLRSTDCQPALHAVRLRLKRLLRQAHVEPHVAVLVAPQ